MVHGVNEDDEDYRGEEDEIYRRHFGDFKRSLFFARVVGIVLLSSASARASSASAPLSSFLFNSTGFFVNQRLVVAFICICRRPIRVVVVVVVVVVVLLFSRFMSPWRPAWRTLVRLRRRRAAVAQTAAARAIIQLAKTTIIITSSSIPTRIKPIRDAKHSP